MSSIRATRDTVQKWFAILVLLTAPGIALAQQHQDKAMRVRLRLLRLNIRLLRRNIRRRRRRTTIARRIRRFK